MRRNLSFFAGILVGALLFGGTAAYAAGILATPIEDTEQIIILNGQKVELTGYNINGNNYFKLRDIAQAVDFGVTWSEASRAIVIDTMVGYTPEGENVAQPTPTQEPQPMTDHSAAANPAIFVDDCTREIYNVIRQTVLDTETVLAGNDANGYNAGYAYARVPSSESTQIVMMEVTAAMGTWPGYSVKTVASGESFCTVKYPAPYSEAASYCQPFIEGLSALSDADKVREIAFFVCDRLTYDAPSTATPRTALVSDSVQKGNCMSYAHNFMFLCNLADIPCVFVHSEDHQWNQVYVDGQWWHVDVTANDTGDNSSNRALRTVICADSDMQGASYIETTPILTDFARELLVPGSTT